MKTFDPWIEKKIASTILPQQVGRTLSAMEDVWPTDAPPLPELIEQFPLGEAALLHLLSVSSICATRMANDPRILLWLANPEVCGVSRGYGRMLAELRGMGSGDIAANNFQLLRLWKAREMTRIALREVAEAADVEEITAELSHLAEICLTQVFRHWNRELRNRLGSPDAEFTILGLGKLGGHELNHSSDIDVIFLYSHEGQLTGTLSYHQWFNRLSEKILETFSVKSPIGSLFRVDLRLRPEGSAGPLARSLESMENYYAGFGETWERLALIKARGISGSEELAYEFLRQHQPFIYPKSPTPDLLDDIAAIKRRIERDIVGRESLDRNVKLGAGGIREIEFIVQALQLIHGARNAFLQETGTLKTLHALAQLDLLPRAEVLALDSAYRFLRRVEHRLQLEAEQQTHTVPEEPEPLRRLGLSLGFASGEELTARLREHMGNVRRIFQRNISETIADGAHTVPDLTIFRDDARATKALADLAQGKVHFHVSPRTRQVFRKLRPLLLERLAKTADPNATLNQFVRFVEAYGLRSLLFELLVVNPRLLELLVKTFDASQFAGDLLIRRPQLLEEITRGTTLDRAFDLADNLTRLDSIGASVEALDPVRAYRQSRGLRILLRDVLGFTTIDTLLLEHSDLAEACLAHISRLLGQENALTVIALGKFGGREITYGADLDVLFVGQETRGAQNLLALMGQRTAEGNISVLDPRLRPDGEKGPIIGTVTTYEAYYETRAQLWEIQSLTRARPVLGPMQNDFIAMAQRIWRRAGQRSDLLAEIDAMIVRIRRDRGTGTEDLDFKTGTGGMIEAEFLVQGLQMRTGVWSPNWSEALTELARQNVLPQAEADQLRSSYQFLRHCESTLRRWENKSVSSLPTDELEQQRLATWLGYQDFKSLLDVCNRTRESIHAIYCRQMK